MIGSYLCDEENCGALELERTCYNEMERESMEFFIQLRENSGASASGFDS